MVGQLSYPGICGSRRHNYSLKRTAARDRCHSIFENLASGSCLITAASRASSNEGCTGIDEVISNCAASFDSTVAPPVTGER
jgi:hypothetical protein